MSLSHQGVPYKEKLPSTILRLRPVYNEGRYIRAQAVLRGLSLRKIIDNLGVSRASVHCVIYGKRRSARIESEIARILGKADWNQVVLEARSEVQKKPVSLILQEMEQKAQAAQNLKPEMTTEEIIAARDWGPYLKAMREQMPEIERREREGRRRRV